MVNTCGDGCQDLTCSRIPNMICYFDKVVELTREFNQTVYYHFGQYAPNDSPSNQIERTWASESKKLAGLHCSAFAEGDKVPPAQLKISKEETTKKEHMVLNSAMSKIAERLESSPGLRGIENQYVMVPLSSEHDIHRFYQEVMKFTYSSLKEIQSSKSLLKLHSRFRLLCAHVDRRRLSMSFSWLLPHIVKPDEFGPVESCEICSKISQTEASKAFLDIMVRNGGFMLSPSRRSADNHQFRCCLEELSRLQVGMVGSSPDELLPLRDIAFAQTRVVKDKRLEDELYPGWKACPHKGCWNFGFTSVEDSKRHEKLMHPGQRAQRKQDRLR